MVAVVAAGFGQRERQIIKTFNADEDCNFVVFEVKGEADVFKWDKNVIRVMTTIQTPEVEDRVLEALIKTERYTFKVEHHQEERVLIFDMPNAENTIIINGTDLFEKLNFEIFIPRRMQYKVINPRAPALM